MPKVSTPPAFFKYTRCLELSLSPDFPKHVWCANDDIQDFEHRHEVYDFHWLHLDRFEKLDRMNIWIASRSITWRVDSDNNFRGIKEFNLEELREMLTAFGNIKTLTISTPLGPGVRPEEGVVEAVLPAGGKLYKRGSGDKFHPFLNLIFLGDGFDGMIWASHKRWLFELLLFFPL